MSARLIEGRELLGLERAGNLRLDFLGAGDAGDAGLGIAQAAHGLNGIPDDRDTLLEADRFLTRLGNLPSPSPTEIR